jgi:hypothetical protein
LGEVFGESLGVFGCLWGCLGGVLGGSFGKLWEGLWAVLGEPRGSLGRPGAVLGPPLQTGGAVDTLRGVFGMVFGSQGGLLKVFG